MLNLVQVMYRFNGLRFIMKVLLQFFFGIRKGYVKETLLLEASLILPSLNSVASESDNSSPVVVPLVLKFRISWLVSPKEACG